MLGLAMLAWVGYEFLAPTWFWVCWFISAALKIIKFGFDMFNAGSEL